MSSVAYERCSETGNNLVSNQLERIKKLQDPDPESRALVEQVPVVIWCA